MERRVLESFCDSNKNTILLPGLSELNLRYLLKDGLLVPTGKCSPWINGVPSWEEYQLTEKGQNFVKILKHAHFLEASESST